MPARPKHVIITPELCRAAYRMLCETAPFNKWNLPSSDEVIFSVSKSRTCSGEYKEWKNSRRVHEIIISARSIGTLNNLVWVMAHEMIHLYQVHCLPRTDTPGVQHNREFKRLADIVCTNHHFDRHMFAEMD